MPFIKISPAGAIAEADSNNIESTTAELHKYIDFDAGDDSNSGDSFADAYATFNGANLYMPQFLNHNTALHVQGANPLNTGDEQKLDFHIKSGVSFVVTGGFENKIDVVATRTIDSSGTGFIGDSTLAMSTDQYYGYIIEILTGPAVGEIRTVQSNTVTTFVPTRKFGVDPVGGTFRIYKPATRIQDTLTLAAQGTGIMYFQNFTLHEAVSKSFSVLHSSGTVQLGQIVDASTSIFAMQVISSANVAFNGTQHSPVTFTTDSFPTKYASVGMVGGGSIVFRGSGIQGINGSAIRSIDITGCWSLGPIVSFGARIKGTCTIKSLGPNLSFFPIFNNSPSYSDLKISDSTGVGLRIIDSFIDIASGASLVVENNTTHGIEVFSSTLVIGGVIAGTGNSGAGCYVHSGSVVHMTDGSTPTLTGTVGNISIDGTTEATTWATVDGGTPYVDLNELSLIKEV